MHDTTDRYNPLQQLEKMLLIRAYEEKAAAMQAAGQAAGTCTAVGQEAAAVGIVAALREDDLILTNHRSAGHLLARGANPARLYAEVLGKATGYCRGKSGSLHISVKELGVVLTSTIVGAELSLAAGVGLARSMQPGDAIVACFFGDGAACEGSFHESLNLAALWQLPILYVCENNQWQAYVHRKETMPIEHIATWASAHGMPAVTIDGNDPEALYRAAQTGIAQIRATGRPYFIEAYTYRLRGHYEPDDQAYVQKSELEHWQQRDPILRLQNQLLASGALSQAALLKLSERIAATIEDAWRDAMAAPYPAPADLLSDVYA